jgi:hypothetical protein
VARGYNQGGKRFLIGNLAERNCRLFRQERIGIAHDDPLEIVNRFGDMLLAEQEYGASARFGERVGKRRAEFLDVVAEIDILSGAAARAGSQR